MALSKERILYLLNAYSANKASEEELRELFVWTDENGHDELLHRHIQKLIDQYDITAPVPPVDWDQVYEQILDKSALSTGHPVIRPIRWFRWVAAAMIASLLVIYVYLNNRPAPKNVIAVKTVHQPATRDVAPPAKTMAILTLADGSKIELDTTGNGTLTRQGNVQVIKKADGQLVYSGAGSADLYNTLNVPRGSKVVTIKLSDGTQVWLNSESSLRYPASFRGALRKVEITGEAYFEVSPNAAAPFIVKKDDMEIRVLGTHFNINTYGDEGMNKVTLLEGSVKISAGGHQNLLKPGQQAQVNDDITLVSGINIEEVMAWKNGKFDFGEKTDLHLIMMKLARWYDVNVEYEGTAINQRFGGEMPMNSNLSEVLEILRTSGVNFTIDGRKIIVKS